LGIRSCIGEGKMNEVKINQLFEIIGEQTVGLKLLEIQLQAISFELKSAKEQIEELKKPK